MAYEIGKATITLRYLKRVGLVNFKRREWWLGQKVFIWSREHGAFWRPEAAGYTMHEAAAGIYEFADAYWRAEHCGPEKKIEFIAARAQPERR